MEQIKELSLFLNVAGGIEKVAEIAISAWEHEKILRLQKQQEVEEEKKAHVDTKLKLTVLEQKHEELKQVNDQLKQASPSLDAHKDVLV